MRIRTTVALLAAFLGSAVRHASAMGLEGADSDFLAPSRPAELSPAPQDPSSSSTRLAKPWDKYQSTLGLNLGIGSAIGVVGVTLAFSPTSFLISEIGIGQGFSGTQFSVMQKVAAGSDDSVVRFISGAGFSLGSGSDTFPHPSLWLNLDLAGMEIRTLKGFVFFMAGGLTLGLAGGKFSYDLYEDCGNRPACSFRNNVRGYVGQQGRVGLAFWF
jgi:hypothetical protein